MRLTVKHGEILDEVVDVLICTANPMLAMSGGMNGALLARGGDDIQDELRNYLADHKVTWVPPGSVIRTGPGPLSVLHVLHAVGVSALYESSCELVASTLDHALKYASRLRAKTVATPAIATGYGPLTISDFASSLLRVAGREYPPIEEVRVVLRNTEHTKEILKCFDDAGLGFQDPESDRPRTA